MGFGVLFGLGDISFILQSISLLPGGHSFGSFGFLLFIISSIILMITLGSFALGLGFGFGLLVGLGLFVGFGLLVELGLLVGFGLLV